MTGTFDIPPPANGRLKASIRVGTCALDIDLALEELPALRDELVALAGILTRATLPAKASPSPAPSS